MADKPKTAKHLALAGVCLYDWGVHFSKRPDKVTCLDCLDFKSGFCKGGVDPIECFKKQRPESGEVIGELDNGSGHPCVVLCVGDCRKCALLIKFLSTPSTVVSSRTPSGVS
ncbi:unnamed protein product [marine sediment metagenome]|uniref:Uncharacterized protein n=1 Tax=marine sediment metagenome TaxID=412755 RepID=X1JAJ3_9ZZZZ